MKRMGSRSRREAFSLIEILIALGLFAVAVSALLSLFPVALRTEKESEEESRATLIASGIMDSLVPSDNGNFLRVATGMSNGLPLWENIPGHLGKSTNLVIAYNVSCEPVSRLTIEEAARPSHDLRISAIVSVSLMQKASLPGMLSAEVSIGSPASAPATGRLTRRLVRLISIP